MKKIAVLLSILILTGLTQAKAATAVGEAAGNQASSRAKGTSEAIGVGVVAALLGVALATAGGGGNGTNTSTSTTTNTKPVK
jgi:hypothetical protein